MYAMGDYIYTRCYDHITGYETYHVKVQDQSKTEYGPIASEINGIPVEDFTGTFAGCVNLVVPPLIPRSALIMDNTFDGCTSLITANIPELVLTANHTFRGCTSLAVPIEIPQNVQEKVGTFEGCTSLMTGADEILSGNEELSLPTSADDLVCLGGFDYDSYDRY